MTASTRVVVVGAGPVGLALAADLRLGDVEVVVLERLAEPTKQSRASTLHARTMETFDQRGLVDDLDSPPNDRMGHFGGIPLDLSESESNYRGQWKVPQTRVERVLTHRARRLGVKIHRRCTFSGLDETEADVRVHYEGPRGPNVIVADYLVGCDGEESAVRSAAGFRTVGHGAVRKLLRADLSGIDVPNRRFERHPAGLAIAARRPDGITRVMVHEFGHAAGEYGPEPDLADVAGAWKRVVGEDIGHATPVWVNSFGDVNRMVTRYRCGRVLLAGDAAHQQMPVGGQALNLGLQDAFNLGWKLAAHVRGAAPRGLLDSYHVERHDVGRRVLANIAAQALLLLGGADVEPLRVVLTELLRHSSVRAQLAGTISGLDIAYAGAEELVIGRRLPHLDIALDTGWSSTTEMLRTGRGLLLDLSADPHRAAALGDLVTPWAARVDLACHTTRRPGSAVSLPDTVLIRPDGYVAWAGSNEADLGEALHHWFGAPEVHHHQRSIRRAS